MTAQWIVIVILGIIVLILLAWQIRNTRKESKEKEAKKKEEEAKKKEEEEKLLEEKGRLRFLREVSPYLFSGGDIDQLDLDYFLQEAMEPEDRDRANAWFEKHKKIIGVFDCNMFAKKEKRIKLSLSEFEDWFFKTFNVEYFATEDLPHGKLASMSFSFDWLEKTRIEELMSEAKGARGKSEKIADVEKQIIAHTNDLAELRKQAALDHNKDRQETAKVKSEAQELLAELKEAQERITKVEQDRWEKLRETLELNASYQKLFKDLEEAKIVQGKMHELQEVKNFLPNLEELKQSIDKIIAKGITKGQQTKLEEMLNARLNNINTQMADWKTLIEEWNSKLKDEENLSGLKKTQLSDLNTELGQFKTKVEEFITKSEADKVKDKNEFFLHWSAQVAGIALGVVLIVLTYSFIQRTKEHSQADDASLMISSAYLNSEELLSDSDPVKSEAVFVKGRPEDLNPLPHLEKPKVEKPKEVCDTVPAFTPVVKKQEGACTTEACCYLKISFDKSLTEEQKVQSRREAYKCTQMLKK